MLLCTGQQPSIEVMPLTPVLGVIGFKLFFLARAKLSCILSTRTVFDRVQMLYIQKLIVGKCYADIPAK